MVDRHAGGCGGLTLLYVTLRYVTCLYITSLLQFYMLQLVSVVYRQQQYND